MSCREFRGGEEARRARMLAWTWKCITGTGDADRRSLEASMACDALIGPQSPRVPSARGKGDIPSARWEPVSQVLEES